MNQNKIMKGDFSNERTKERYWYNCNKYGHCHYNESQCLECIFYLEFNLDYGLCSNKDSEHHLETVFEHYACSKLERQPGKVYDIIKYLTNCITILESNKVSLKKSDKLLIVEIKSFLKSWKLNYGS